MPGNALELPLKRLFQAVDPNSTGFCTVNDVTKILRGWSMSDICFVSFTLT